MALPPSADSVSPPLQRIPLRWVLIVPFLLQVAAAVSLTGWLSLRSGRVAVQALASQLHRETSDRIEQHLNEYLAAPRIVTQSAVETLEPALIAPDNAAQIERYFWKQIRVLASIDTLQLGTADGRYLGAGRWPEGFLVLKRADPVATNGEFRTYATDAEGRATTLLASRPDYDPRERPWYKAAIAQNRPTWSPIYVMFSQQVLGMTLAQPLRTATGDLVGVVGADILLAELSNFLAGLPLSERGETFLLDAGGALIASSSQAAAIDPESSERLLAQRSDNPRIAATTQALEPYLEAPVVQELTLELAGERHFVRLQPLAADTGLEWFIVVVVPEQDFLTAIQANQRQTILLCAIALLLATGLGILTSRWIAAPILQLSQASSTLAVQLRQEPRQLERTFSRPSTAAWLPRITELRALAHAFNDLAQQLQTAFAALEASKLDLEQRVQARTAQLRAAEAEMQTLFEAMTEAIFVFDGEGRYLKIPSANPELLYRPREEMIGRTLHECFPPAQADDFLSKIRTVLTTGTPAHFEYALVIAGQEAWFAANISPINAGQVVWVARDISERRLLERQLRTSEGKMRTVFEAMSDIVLVLEVQAGAIANIEIPPTNPARLYGPAADPVGATIMMLSGQEREAWSQTLTQVVGQQEAIHFDYQLDLGGRNVWFDASLSPISATGAIWVARDITDRKRAEADVQLLLAISQAVNSAPDFNRALYDILRLVCEAAGWPYGEVWVPSADGGALECHPSWYPHEADPETAPGRAFAAPAVDIAPFRDYSEALVFLPGEELPGQAWQRGEPVLWESLAAAQDDVYLRLERGLECGLRAGFSLPILVAPATATPAEAQAVPPAQADTTPQVLAVLTFFTAEPRDRDARFCQLIAEIAAQLGAALRQRQADAELKALFAAMTDLIFVFDANGRHLKIPVTNANDLLYEATGTRIGKTLHDVFPKPIADQFLGYIRQALTSQKTLQVEYNLEIDGREVWSDASISPISLDAVIWVARNVSDRKAAEATLLKRQRYSTTIVEVQRALLSSAGVAGDFDYQTLLAPLGEVSGASRVYLFALNRDAQGRWIGRPQAEWCAPDIPPPSPTLRPESFELDQYLPHFSQLLQQGSAIAGIASDFSGPEGHLLQAENIQAILVLPILVNGELFGCIGFDECRQARHWEQDEIDLLEAIAAAVGLWQERRQATLALQRQAERDNHLSRISRQFLEDHLDAATQYALQVVGEFVGCDRAYVMRYSPDLSSFSNTQEWCRPGIIPCIDATQAVPATTLPWLHAQYCAGQIVQLDDLAQLPNRAEQDYLKAQGIQSLLNVPMIYSGRLVGFLGLDAVNQPHTWTAGEIKLLRLLGDTIAVAQARHEAEEALRQEQEKSEALLLNILPKPIAEQLKQHQGSLAEQFNEVTILFADIVGFTPLSASLQPIELVDMLNEIFSRFDDLAERLGIEKIKTIGDAYMVASGLPVPRADHALVMAEMALAMQTAIAPLKTPHGNPLQIRIGINTGVVVAGVIGTKKFIYDLWGDAVNIASRMESQGEPGCIQVTEATYSRIQERFHLEPRGPIPIKGKGTMMAYWLRGRRF